MSFNICISKGSTFVSLSADVFNGFPFILVGNKQDRRSERVVSPAEAEAWCRLRNNIPFYEVGNYKHTAFREMCSYVKKACRGVVCGLPQKWPVSYRAILVSTHCVGLIPAREGGPVGGAGGRVGYSACSSLHVSFVTPQGWANFYGLRDRDLPTFETGTGAQTTGLRDRDRTSIPENTLG